MTDYSELVKIVNIPELVKALRHCADGSSIRDCADCEYEMYDDCTERLIKDAAAAIEELQQIADHYEQTAKDYWKEACEYKAQLPKRGEIVRCGECKWLFDDSNTFFKPCEAIIPEKDWYCAYGERREG